MTRGCIRKVTGRNRPRSAGSVRSAAEDVLEGRRAGAVGMDALADLGELVRVAEQDDRAGGGRAGQRVRERLLAGLVDEQDVERPIELRAGEQPAPSRPRRRRSRRRPRPRCRRSTPRPPRAGVRRPRRPSIRWSARSGTPASRAASDRLDEQVRDRLVGLGRDADAPAGPDELDDHPGAGPGLAGARRSLDREDGLRRGQGERQPARGVERPARPAATSGSPAASSADPRRPAEEQVADRPVRAAAVEAALDDRVGDPAERAPEGPRVDGRALEQRLRRRRRVLAGHA